MSERHQSLSVSEFDNTCCTRSQCLHNLIEVQLADTLNSSTRGNEIIIDKHEDEFVAYTSVDLVDNRARREPSSPMSSAATELTDCPLSGLPCSCTGMRVLMISVSLGNNPAVMVHSSQGSGRRIMLPVV